MEGTAKSRKRIDWVDFAKGFAILLVFWGHSICPESVRSVFYAFHIPVFYFLSGFVFSIDKYKTIWPFLWRKLRTLIIPGLFFAVLILIIQVVNGICIGVPYEINVIHLILGAFIELRGSEWSFLPWFFVSLFIIEIAAYFILHYISQKPGVLLLLATLSSLGGYFYAVFISHIVPWCLDTALSGFFFFMLGYLYRFYQSKMTSAFKMRWLPAWAAGTICFAMLNLYVMGQKLDIYANIYGLYFFYLPAALAGIGMVLTLMQKLDYSFYLHGLKRVLRFLGKNSLIFYCMNSILILIVKEILIYAGWISADIQVWYLQLIWGLFILVAACLLCCPVAFVVNRFMPGVLGKQHTFLKK